MCWSSQPAAKQLSEDIGAYFQILHGASQYRQIHSYTELNKDTYTVKTKAAEDVSATGQAIIGNPRQPLGPFETIVAVEPKLHTRTVRTLKNKAYETITKRTFYHIAIWNWVTS